MQLRQEGQVSSDQKDEVSPNQNNEVKSDQQLEQGQGRDRSRRDCVDCSVVGNNLWFSSPAFPLG